MQTGIPFPDLSPELFSISLFGIEFALRWYALAYIVGIVIAWRLCVAAVRRPALWPGKAAPMTPQQIEDLLTWVVIGIVLGGRLGFVLVYQPGYYLAHPAEILRVWQGGMSFHGGLAGVILAAWIYTGRQGIARLPAADLIAHSVAPGLLLGRLANFINAELWGRATDVPWGVIFPGAAAQDCGQAVGELCARHPSQLYEAGLEGLLLGLVILVLIHRGALKMPGLILGTFLTGYGLARFIVEFFRQPDAQFQTPGNPLGLAFHIDGFGLTMGQTLTIPMIAIGVYFILRALRQRPAPATA